MAVQPQTPYKEYTANGSTNSFALEFDCENQDHLIVLVDDVEPVVGTWSLSDGAVVFGTAPINGKKITIQRNTPFRRDGDFQSYDNSFRPGSVNKGFDWIWLKLQELGVTDWILGNRIDALKNYVDDKDNELRSYLLEEIRKQGVALDQLDDYYNYLMQRLAQIAVQGGWEASFVVDKSGKTQQEINDFLLSPKFLTFDMFNVPTTNSSAKIQAVLDLSASLKVPIVNTSGTYELDSPITIKYDHDLTGTNLKVKSTLVGSAVTITRDDTPTTDHEDGSTLINNVKTFGVWEAKNPQYSNFNVPELNNSYLIISTNQDFYRYRTEVKKRIELLKYFRNGSFESGCYFDFDFSKVTNIKCQKIAPYIMQSKGLSFDESEATCAAILRVLDCNKIDISGLNFSDNSTVDRDGAQNKLIYVRAHDITCDHPFFESSNKHIASNRTSYVISLNLSYQPEFTGIRSSNVNGAAANNLCRRVKFTDCNLNLIDFHEPCFEYLKIIGGTISSGVQASIVGDLYLNNVRQTYRPNGSSQPNGAIVRTRDDIGGWFCGDIYIDNHVIDGAVTTHTPLFYIGSNSTDNLIPVGSPIPSRFANNIYVDGIKVNNKHIVHSIIQANLQGTTPYLELPKLIKISNFELTDDHTNPLLFYVDHFKNVSSYKELILDNLRVGTLLIGGGDSLDMVTVKDSKKQDGSGFSFFNMSAADITVTGDTVLYQYSEKFSGTYSIYTPKVRLNHARFVSFNLSSIIDTNGNTFGRIKSNKLETLYLTTKGDFLKNQLNKVAIDSFIDNGATGFVVYFSSAINTVTTQVSIGQDSMDFEVLYNDGKPRSAILTVRPLDGAQSVSGGVSADVTVSGGLATIAFTATNITKVLLVKNR